MYYKLRCNSTQFVIYYKLRNYYKLQRNSASQCRALRKLLNNAHVMRKSDLLHD